MHLGYLKNIYLKDVLNKAGREDSGPLPPLTQTVHPPPLWQEAALHQDQNLSPLEQFLPLRYRPLKQGPAPQLTLYLSHNADSMPVVTNQSIAIDRVRCG